MYAVCMFCVGVSMHGASGLLCIYVYVDCVYMKTVGMHGLYGVLYMYSLYTVYIVSVVWPKLYDGMYCVSCVLCAWCDDVV